MNKLQQNYILRHDMFVNNEYWSSYDLEEYDPFNTGCRLIITSPPKFLINLVNTADMILKDTISWNVRDVCSTIIRR